MIEKLRGLRVPPHGWRAAMGFMGRSDPLRVLRIRKYPSLVHTVGARWPYAITLFGYVRRARPCHEPKSLTEVAFYAIPAHLLHMIDLVGSDAVMNRTTRPRVVMPALATTVLSSLGTLFPFL